jgi:hypothetical protein
VNYLKKDLSRAFDEAYLDTAVKGMLGNAEVDEKQLQKQQDSGIIN